MRETSDHRLLRGLCGLITGANLGTGIRQVSRERLISLLSSGQPAYQHSNIRLERHMRGEIDLYYSSYFSQRNKRVYINVDNDVKVRDDGEIVGEEDLARWHDEVLADLLPGARPFPSRGGIGSHVGFYVTDDPGSSRTNAQRNEDCRDLTLRLQRALERHRGLRGYGFTQVEVKGTCASTVYDGDTLVDVRYGSLCLLPRTRAHIDYVRDEAPTFTLSWLEETVARLERANDELDSLGDEQVTLKVRDARAPSGSFRPRIVDVDWNVGKLLLASNRVMSRDGRYASDHRHMSVLLSIVAALRRADEARHGRVLHMAFSRIRGMWLALLESGEIDIPWCDRRVTAMRDWLGERGFIVMRQSGYCAGQACVWWLDDCIQVLVGEGEKQHSTCVVTRGDINNINNYVRPHFDQSLNPQIAQFDRIRDWEREVESLLYAA